MSKLESISIKGIRSYSPNYDCVINFEENLNLFHGRNGSGKTTILECIKLLLTGKFPSGTRMNNFVNDLKKNKIETKTLESYLECEETNKKSHVLSSRALDSNHEIGKIIGINNSIMDFIVLCEFEDSIWPLAESKILKERFDEIFDTSKYNKALDEIRNIRKKKSQYINEIEIRVAHLDQDYKKSQQIKLQIDQLERQITEKNEQINIYLKRVEAIDIDVKILNEQSNKVKIAEDKSNELKILNKRLETEVAYISQNLSSLPTDKYESLEKDLLLNDERLKNELFSFEKHEKYVNVLRAENDENKQQLNKEKIKHSLYDRNYKDIVLKYHQITEIVKCDTITNENQFIHDIEHLKQAYKEYKTKNKQIVDLHVSEINNMLMTIEKTKTDEQKISVKKGKLDSEKESKLNLKRSIESQIDEIKLKIITLKNENEEKNDIERELSEKSKLLDDLKNDDFSDYNDKISKISNFLTELTDIKSKLEINQIFYQNKLFSSKEYEATSDQIIRCESNITEIFRSNNSILELLKIDSFDTTSENIKLINDRLETHIIDTDKQINQFQSEISLVQSQNQQILKSKHDTLDRIENFNNLIKELSPIIKQTDMLNYEQLEFKIVKNTKKIIKHDTIVSLHQKMFEKVQLTNKCPTCESELNDAQDKTLTFVWILENKSLNHSNKSKHYQNSLKNNKEEKIQQDEIIRGDENLKNYIADKSELELKLNSLNSEYKKNEHQEQKIRTKLKQELERKKSLDKAIIDITVGNKIISEIHILNNILSKIPYIDTTKGIYCKIIVILYYFYLYQDIPKI
ncbi:hypothetical protein HZS_7142, partial [Henneguya salminicola]